MKKKLMASIVASGAAIAGILSAAGPASAAVITSNCGSGAQMCLFYHSLSNPGGLGAEYGNSNNVKSFNPNVNGGNTYEFKSGVYGTSGAGQTVWNNAGGAGDYSPSQNFAVWYNSSWTGAYDVVPYGKKISLTRTYNQDASMGWI